MSMKDEHRNVPKLRFQGFTDGWEQRKVLDIAPLQRGFDLPTSQMKEGPYPVVMSNGIGGYHSEYKAKGPGVITGRSGTIGKIHYIEDDYWPHNTSLWVTDFKGNNPKFIYYLYQCIDLSNYRTGSGVPTLNRNDVHNAIASIPTNDEQEIIALFLTELDNTITIHQHKFDKIKEYKQGMLQKMFPKKGEEVPEIRFPGFTDDWEQRKLIELADFNPKSVLPDTFEYVDLESVVGTEMISHRTENKGTAPSRAQRLARMGDLFYQTVRPYQRNNYLFEKADDNYVFSTGYAQMRPYCDGRFLLGLVQTDAFVNTVLDHCTGTSYPAINSNDLSEIEVYYPLNDKEQQQIGSFLASLDKTISLHQRKLDAMKDYKKCLLQQMFV